MRPKIFIIDDSAAILAMLKEFLEGEGSDVETFPSAEKAIKALESDTPDLVIMDIRMPGMNGLDALREIKAKDPKLTVIIMTAYGTTETAIEAMKRGAYDYVTKPFKNDEFKVLVKKAVKSAKLMREEVLYEATEKISEEGTCIVGDSVPMREIYKTIGRVAESNATVLIQGESGTGKELVARAVYQHSARKDGPFLAVNCAAIPESLLESELFGHEKGSFTGAINKRIGKFQQCDGGTIFLDEIGDMPLATQTKILRVLQEHTFEPVGSEETVKVDVRVIASTNRDLDKAMKEGEFREDLYFRVKVVTIFMPPLRDRTEDIPLLADYFVRKFNSEYGKNLRKFSPEVIDHLKRYGWPGNVRELENAVQTAVVMSKKDVLFLEDFPLFRAKRPGEMQQALAPFGDHGEAFRDVLKPVLEDFRSLPEGKLHKKVIRSIEKTLIDMVLEEVGRSQSKAARALGISRNTLRTRMREYGLE